MHQPGAQKNAGLNLLSFQVRHSMYLNSFLLNFAVSLTGPSMAFANGGTIVLSYVWLSLARSAALRHLVSVASAS